MITNPHYPPRVLWREKNYEYHPHHHHQVISRWVSVFAVSLLDLTITTTITVITITTTIIIIRRASPVRSLVTCPLLSAP